jgi:hypothetical protein
MAKFHGKVGFITYVESEGSVYKECVTEKGYYGDVIRLSRRYAPSETINDDLTLNAEISIVADAFAYQNFQSLRYVNYQGANWEVTSAAVERPRIIMQIGGVYNGSKGPETRA